MAEPEFKVAGLLSMVRTLREMIGEPAWQALLEGLPADTRELIRQPPLAMSWAANHHFDRVVEAACAGPFGGDLTRVTELAKRAMLGDLSTVYRVFIRLASPDFVLKRAAKIYETYTRNNGQFRVTASGEGFAELTIEDLAAPSPAAWAYNEGAIRAVIAATGLKEANVTVAEGGGSDRRCVFRATWR